MRRLVLLALVLPACSPAPKPGGAPADAGRDAQPRSFNDRDNDGYLRTVDCNDTNPAVHPGAPELCNAVDDNCNGRVDDSATDAPTWYRDTDADGYGVAAGSRRACAQPAGYAAASGDCAASDPARSPGAAEACNDLDDDCDTLTDDADPSLDLGTASTWHADSDGDGFGDPATSLTTCDAPAGWVADGTDCLDSDATVFPDEAGVCAPCPTGFTWDGATCTYDWSDDYAALTAGVTRIGTGGSIASLLIVHGDGAFPLFVDGDNNAFAAAGHLGEGRAVHVGHEGLLSPSSLNNRTFLLNAVRWAGQGTSPVVGVESGLGSLSSMLVSQGFTVRTIGVSELDTVDVYVTTSYTERSEADYEALRAWVAGGGGYISGGHAWYWAYSNENPAENYPGNQVLNAVGITVTGSYDVASASVTVPSTPPGPLTHAGYALDAIAGHFDGSAPLGDVEARTAADTVTEALANLPLSFEAWYAPVVELVGSLDLVYPSLGDPVVPATEPLDAVVVMMEYALAAGLPADELFAIPSDFPGEVSPLAERGVTNVTIDATYAGRDGNYGYSGAGEPVWRATGLYAAPGEVVTVSLPPGWEGQGLTALVGAHTDWIGGLGAWYRHPGITRSWSLDEADTDIGNAFGGPIYLRVPAGLALGEGEVSLSGAVAMPTYVHGVSDPATFLAEVAAAEVPLVELSTDSFAMVLVRDELPADLDPSSLMDLWQGVLDADADLAAVDRERVRAERLSMDVQISAGWMHSGYPIMAYQYTSTLADADWLWTWGDWGAFHEIGHNHQYAPENLPGTTECTVNLWSVYAMENVVGVDRDDAHPAIAPDARAGTIDAYIAGGRDFWGAWNTWTCLETYLELQEAFGWEALIDLHATYLAMPSGSMPDTDQERIDTWVVQSSLEVGYDLTDFYAAWGFPMSTSTYTAVSGLPPWTDHPLAGR